MPVRSPAALRDRLIGTIRSGPAFCWSALFARRTSSTRFSKMLAFLRGDAAPCVARAKRARLWAEGFFSRRMSSKKTDLDFVLPSADGGTLRGSCSINRRNILYRQSERTSFLLVRFLCFAPFPCPIWEGGHIFRPPRFFRSALGRRIILSRARAAAVRRPRITSEEVPP